MTQIYEELCELVDRGEPCALATLVSTSGSSPQNTGAKLLILPNGRILGTIGGGCMEAEARKVALDCLRKKETRLFSLRLDDDFGWDDGLICGGRVDIFINPLVDRSADVYRAALEAARRRERSVLATFLAGENTGITALLAPSGVVSPSPLDRLSPPLQEAATLVLEKGKEERKSLEEGVDDRPSFANRDRLPWADRVAVEDIPSFVRDFPLDDQSYVVIVTRGHRHDAQVLRECIHSNARYLGMIGSKRKIVVIFEEMLREGLATPEELRRVRSPMGLTLGDREVGEIAVSIMAEIVAVRNGADLGAIRPMQYSPPFLQP